MSDFYLASPSSSPTSTPARRLPSDFSDDDDDLPYPQPLQRDSFLQRDFDPSTYLSEYIKTNRHQTLADLRSELRERSQKLQQELLDLVNAEYQAFLTLGSDLKGGEEKVEGVRVGVLRFVNGVSGVRQGVRRRREEVEALIKEREDIATEKEVAGGLVEVYERVGELEEGLQGTEVSDEDDEDDGEDEDMVGGVSLRRFKRLVGSYVVLRQMMEGIGVDHPFLLKQEERVIRIRNTLLLDMGAAVRQARSAGSAGHDRLLKLVSLYADMGEEKEGIKVLRGHIS